MLRIALVSFEFPPETNYGGIGSYMHEVAIMLSGGGHYVEVFCGGERSSQIELNENLVVNRIGDMDKDTFAESLVPVFRKRHQAKNFDVVESVDFHSDARVVRKEFQELPMVIKLHTPTFLASRLNGIKERRLSLLGKLRFAIGALRRGRIEWPKEKRILSIRNAWEQGLYYSADVVLSPSRDLIRLVESEWGVRPDGIGLAPYPYSPSIGVLGVRPKIPSEPVLYIGRLEMRKGVSDLIEALAILERQGRPVKTRFVGSPFPSPQKGLAMDKWAEKKLDMASGRYVFTGQIPRSEIHSELEKAGLVIFPARWENFPYTCLEAMAAGCVVIGSSAGGMSDMITDGIDGFIIQPNSPEELADKIWEILTNSERYREVSSAARERVLSAYSCKTILPQQIEFYNQAIRKKQVGAKPR